MTMDEPFVAYAGPGTSGVQTRVTGIKTFSSSRFSSSSTPPVSGRRKRHSREDGRTGFLAYFDCERRRLILKTATFFPYHCGSKWNG
jgi:hypothetical protein